MPVFPRAPDPTSLYSIIRHAYDRPGSIDSSPPGIKPSGQATHGRVEAAGPSVVSFSMRCDRPARPGAGETAGAVQRKLSRRRRAEWRTWIGICRLTRKVDCGLVSNFYRSGRCQPNKFGQNAGPCLIPPHLRTRPEPPTPARDPVSATAHCQIVERSLPARLTEAKEKPPAVI